MALHHSSSLTLVVSLPDSLSLSLLLSPLPLSLLLPHSFFHILVLTRCLSHSYVLFLSSSLVIFLTNAFSLSLTLSLLLRHAIAPSLTDSTYLTTLVVSLSLAVVSLVVLFSLTLISPPHAS